LLSLKQTLFNQDDIAGVLSLVRIGKYGEEIIYDSKKRSIVNHNREDITLISNLPREIAK
jgi:hypothetical protein